MTGFTFEPFKRTDYAFEKAFSVSDTPIVPLNRSIDGIDVIYQGNTASCVSCAVTWIQQWYEQSGIRLSWPFLAEESGTTNVGNKPSNVLTVAKNVGICPWDVFGKPEDVEKSEASGHRIKNYSFLSKITPQTLYSALKQGPLAIGIVNYQGLGYDHMVAAYDVNENGTGLKCVTWDNPDVQSLVEIPFNQVTVAISFATIQGVDISNITMSLLSVLKSKLSTSKVVIGLLALALIGSFGTTQIDSPAPQEQNFGQSGVSLGYAPSIASPGISNTATSIPVTSLTLFTGETITTSTILFPAYFVINPGSLATQELVECWGLTTTTTSPTWTLCNRGMSALGGPATSTVSGAAYPHSAGEKFVMTNAPPFFNRFVDTMTNQYATGTKRFTSDQLYLGSSTGSSGPKLLFSNGQSANPYFRVVSGGSGTSTFYVSFDGSSESQLNTGGTVYGASNGITISAGLISVNASTTAGMAFDSNGRLYVPVGLGLSYNTSGALQAVAGNVGLFGRGTSASTTGSGTTTLTGDVSYTNFTVATGTILVTAGYRVYVNGYLFNQGTISNTNFQGTGGSGGNGSNGTGTGGAGGATGTAGIASLGGFFPAGVVGAIGGQGGMGETSSGAGDPGLAGGAGGTSYRCTNTTATAGSAGGNGGGSGTAAGGAAGTAGVCTTTQTNPITNVWHSDFWFDFSSTNTLVAHSVNAPSGGSGGGGGGGVSSGGSGGGGGGGGGSGGGGGVVFVAASSLINTGTISALGAAGGSGGNGGNGTTGQSAGGGGGGGGGSGGVGGVIILISQNYLNSGTVTAAGGPGGAGGTGGLTGLGGASGSDGTTGSTGASGTVMLFTNQ